jgi:putative glutamine amidotransferase
MRVVVSFSKPEKGKKYKGTLKGIGGGDLELVDADSNAAAPTGGWRTLVQEADALLLTGGPDVEPARYGEAVDPNAEVESIPARDAMEWGLLAAARDARLPVLGICRGHQVVHAFLGGGLWQDLGALGEEVKRRHDPDESNRRLLAHGLEVGSTASPLGELLRTSSPFAVNSLHHQAVRVAGEGMRIVATSPDGVVEATEGSDPGWWVWTVQWHPEELVATEDQPVHRRLFERFLEQAGNAAARRAGGRVEALP